MKAIDFKDYIGCECLIFDSTDPNEGTPAIIEGIDIVANTVICERANFDPNIIKLPKDIYLKEYNRIKKQLDKVEVNDDLDVCERKINCLLKLFLIKDEIDKLW